MKRITPDRIYRGQPCSLVATGCALGITKRDALCGLKSKSLRKDGYLSADAMNRLVRANLAVTRRLYFRRGRRPLLREYAHKAGYAGIPAIILVKGHYVYFDGRDYYSFLKCGGKEVINVWQISPR